MQPYIFNGQFIKDDAYKKVIWALVGMLLGVSIVTYLMSSNMLLTVFGFITTLIAAVALLIFLQDRYTLEVEVLRTPERKFEVLVKGADMHIVNPQTVYFGVQQNKEGQRFLNLGIPNGTSLLVLQESLPNNAYKEVNDFLVPRDFLGQDLFISKSKPPGDLVQLVKVLGFV